MQGTADHITQGFNLNVYADYILNTDRILRALQWLTVSAMYT